jgi:hypothetical protein
MEDVVQKKKPIRKQKYIGTVEICRSFAYKMNVGNYESRDFFMSQKAECLIADAEKTSEALHAFCKSQVLNSVNEYIEDAKKQFSKGEQK